MKKKNMFLVLAAGSISSQALCQDTTSTAALNEVVVTATKFPQKQSTTGKVISVIDKETLRRNAGRTIAEIINTQAGIFINGANNNPGTNLDVYFRGASSGNTLILIDGVPVGDASQINNAFDLNHMIPAQVERIEILKGAQSTLWGSDAVAGVINIITAKGGPAKLTPSAFLSYGTYHTFRGNAGINGMLQKLSYNINYSHARSRGCSNAYDSTGSKNFDNDKFVQNNIQASLGYQLNDRFAIKGLYRFDRYTSGIDAAAFKDDKDYTTQNRNDLKNLELTYNTEKVKLHLTQTFINTKRAYTDDSTDVGGFARYANGTYKGNTAITELYGNIALAPWLSLVSGLQYLSQRTSRDYLSVSSYGTSRSALGDTARANNLSAYSSLLLTGLKGFNLEAGLRYNRHSLYGSNATYTINPSYNIDDQAKLFVNISSAYKIPSLYQLYSEYGNKALKPEQTNNLEIGVQAFSNHNRNSYRITAFKRDSRNLIIFYSDAGGTSRYLNRDEQHDYGFELESNIAIGAIGNLVNNLTYVDGTGKNNGESVRNLYRRPNFVLRSMLNLQPIKNLTLSPAFSFVSTRQKGEYDAGPDLQPQYYTIDLYAGYTFMKKIRIFIDLRNITNQQYFDIVGYNSRRFNMMAGIGYNF